MTQKNGTIEFIREEGQAPNVFIKETKKMVSFCKMSKKLFTNDPFVIIALDRLGYKRGKVKVDGVAVLASLMTEDEKERAQKNLARQAEKVGSEIPKVIISEIEDSVKEDEVKEEIKEVAQEKEVVIDEPKVEKKENKKQKKSASSRLKKEIGIK